MAIVTQNIPLSKLQIDVHTKLIEHVPTIYGPGVVEPKSALDNVKKISFRYDVDKNLSNCDGWICEANWKQVDYIYIYENFIFPNDLGKNWLYAKKNSKNIYV